MSKWYFLCMCGHPSFPAKSAVIFVDNQAVSVQFIVHKYDKQADFLAVMISSLLNIILPATLNPNQTTHTCDRKSISTLRNHQPITSQSSEYYRQPHAHPRSDSQASGAHLVILPCANQTRHTHTGLTVHDGNNCITAALLSAIPQLRVGANSAARNSRPRRPSIAPQCRAKCSAQGRGPYLSALPSPRVAVWEWESRKKAAPASPV